MQQPMLLYQMFSDLTIDYTLMTWIMFEVVSIGIFENPARRLTITMEPSICRVCLEKDKIILDQPKLLNTIKTWNLEPEIVTSCTRRKQTVQFLVGIKT